MSVYIGRTCIGYYVVERDTCHHAFTVADEPLGTFRRRRAAVMTICAAAGGAAS